MKLLREFVLREVVGEILLIPVGEYHDSFNGIITTNETGKFIWENLENVKNENELVDIITREYDVDREIAKKDVEVILQQFRHYKIIE